MNEETRTIPARIIWILRGVLHCALVGFMCTAQPYVVQYARNPPDTRNISNNDMRSPRSSFGDVSATYTGVKLLTIPTPNPEITRPAYIIASFGGGVAVCKTPPSIRKAAAIVIIGFRPTNRDNNAGKRAPKNAPAFNRATMFEETSAAFAAFVEILNSVEKLRFLQLENDSISGTLDQTNLFRASTEPATPVS